MGDRLGRDPAGLRRRLPQARSTPASAARSPTAPSSRFPGQTSLQAGGERAGKRVRVTTDDVLAIGELPLVKNVSPEFMQEFPIVYGNKQSSHLVRGVAASYGEMRSETPQAGGRFLDEEDVRLRRRVAFIGSEVAAQAVRRPSRRSARRSGSAGSRSKSSA